MYCSKRRQGEGPLAKIMFWKVLIPTSKMTWREKVEKREY